MNNNSSHHNFIENENTLFDAVSFFSLVSFVKKDHRTTFISSSFLTDK